MFRGRPGDVPVLDNHHLTSTGHEFLAEFAADTLSAPLSVPAVSETALTATNSFLRTLEQIAGDHGSTQPGAGPASWDAGELRTISISTATRTGAEAFEGPALGFEYTVASVTGGVALAPSEYAFFGLVGGYQAATSAVDQLGGSVDLDSYKLGIIAGYDDGVLFAGTGLTYGLDDYRLLRQTYVPELVSSAALAGVSLGGFARTGVRLPVGPSTIGPLVGVRYSQARIEAYDESGAPGLDMHVQAQALQDLVGSAGLATTLHVGSSPTRLLFHAELLMEGDLGGDRTVKTSLITVPDVDRHLEVEELDDVYARLSGGLSFAAGRHLAFEMSGEITLGRIGGYEHALGARLSALF